MTPLLKQLLGYGAASACALAVDVIVLPTPFMIRIAVRNDRVAPMIIPCTTPDPEIHARILAMSAQ